jgi:hypothetical protein
MPSIVVEATRNWLERVVIGLDLCPFAKAPHRKGLVRYAVSTAEGPEALEIDLASELSLLSAADPVELETTLLIHPGALTDFLDYNEFLSAADAVLGKLGLAGELQVASFHPEYRYAGSDPNDIANFTNRSPYPMLHLLREASVTRAVAAFPEASRIYEKNIATLQALGHAGLRRCLAGE